MTKALTPKDFTPHIPLALSKEERDALPDIEWDNYTAPQYKHLCSTNALGVWTIGHPSPNRDGFEPVSISYQSPMLEGEDYNTVSDGMRELEKQGINAGHVEWNTLFSKMRGDEVGYAYDQDTAKSFLDLARRSSVSKEPSDILTEGGFKFQHTLASRSPGLGATHVFRKEAKNGGSFSVFLSEDHAIHLIHEKRNATSWDNLLRMSLYQESQSGFLIPLPQSPEINNLLAVSCEMAVKISNEWAPQPTSRRRVSP